MPAKIGRHCENRGGLALVAVGQVASVLDQRLGAANKTFHEGNSLSRTAQPCNLPEDDHKGVALAFSR